MYFSGNYWIDPNGGVANDAVLAHCQFDSSATCILPSDLKVQIANQFTMHKLLLGLAYSYFICSFL